MRDWNVIVTVHEDHFNKARQFLEALGEPDRTDYFNVLVMKVVDIEQFLEDIKRNLSEAQNMEHVISRVMPASVTFDYQTPDEFKTLLMDVVDPWVPKLANKRFHVRMHRRGFKGRLSSHDEERALADFLLSKLAQQHSTANVEFDDPDYTIDIETVGQRAGVVLLTREQRLRYPFLKPD